MNNSFKYLVVISILHVSTSFAEQECWDESQNLCSVTGILETQIYPGPPEYEDITKGDAKEEGLYLRLDRPLTIHFRDWEQKYAPTTKSISLIQVAETSEHFYKLGEKRTHVAIRGKIFASFNAHHHTDFLFDPDSHISADKK